MICTVVINQEKLVLTNYYGLNQWQTGSKISTGKTCKRVGAVKGIKVIDHRHHFGAHREISQYSDETYLLEDSCNELEQLNDMPIICGGDWNLVLENIDKKGGPLLSNKKNRENKTFYRKNDS